MSLRAIVRQWRYPREFRIRRSIWIGERTLGLLEAALTGYDGKAGPLMTEGRLLADVGTGLWRLRERLASPQIETSPEAVRLARRHLESTWDVLVEAGVDIRDHKGELMPEGGVRQLKVIVAVPTAGVPRETVTQTVKPTIYYRNQLIQMGEVVTAVPEESFGSPRGGQ